MVTPSPFPSAYDQRITAAREEFAAAHINAAEVAMQVLKSRVALAAATKALRQALGELKEIGKAFEKVKAGFAATAIPSPQQGPQEGRMIGYSDVGAGMAGLEGAKHVPEDGQPGTPTTQARPSSANEPEEVRKREHERANLLKLESRTKQAAQKCEDCAMNMSSAQQDLLTLLEKSDEAIDAHEEAQRVLQVVMETGQRTAVT